MAAALRLLAVRGVSAPSPRLSPQQQQQQPQQQQQRQRQQQQQHAAASIAPSCSRSLHAESAPLGRPSSPGPAQAKSLLYRVSPAARLLLHLHGVDPSSIVPSSPRGILTKEEAVRLVQGRPRVKQEAHSPRAPPLTPGAPPLTPGAPPLGPAPSTRAPPPPAPRGVAPPPGTRRSQTPRYTDVTPTAPPWVTHKAAPHFYSSVACDLRRLIQLQTSLQQSDGFSVSLTTFIIKAVAQSLQVMPTMNACWAGDGGDGGGDGGDGGDGDGVKPRSSVDVSVAVATDRGTLLPMVTGAHRYGLHKLGSIVTDLEERAKAGSLKPEENSSGAFIVSPLSSVSAFVSSLPPAHSSLLAVGGVDTQMREEGGGEPEGGPPEGGLPEGGPPPSGGAVSAVPVLSLSLASDGRVVDQASAAAFLQLLRRRLENPSSLAL